MREKQGNKSTAPTQAIQCQELHAPATPAAARGQALALALRMEHTAQELQRKQASAQPRPQQSIEHACRSSAALSISLP